MNKKTSTSISINKKILSKAQNKIDTLFSGNRSAYVNYLMAKDIEDIPEEKAPPEEKNKLDKNLDSCLSFGDNEED